VGKWTGLSWLRVEKVGGYLWMRYWTFGFHKIRGISWLSAKRLASQGVLPTVVRREWGGSDPLGSFAPLKIYSNNKPRMLYGPVDETSAVNKFPLLNYK
jgi:hypothetical protein